MHWCLMQVTEVNHCQSLLCAMCIVQEQLVWCVYSSRLTALSRVSQRVCRSMQ